MLSKLLNLDDKPAAFTPTKPTLDWNFDFLFLLSNLRFFLTMVSTCPLLLGWETLWDLGVRIDRVPLKNGSEHFHQSEGICIEHFDNSSENDKVLPFFWGGAEIRSWHFDNYFDICTWYFHYVRIYSWAKNDNLTEACILEGWGVRRGNCLVFCTLTVSKITNFIFQIMGCLFMLLKLNSINWAEATLFTFDFFRLVLLCRLVIFFLLCPQ